jgi:hypothetical protein
MIFPEFNKVELSFKKRRRDGQGAYWDRGHIVKMKEVKKFFGKKNVFISTARYKDLDEYTRQQKSQGNVYKWNGKGMVAGFDGEVYYDFLVIDIDYDDVKKTILFIEHLEINYEIPKEILRIYFSGKKGFHVLIPSTIFDLKPSDWLDKQVGNIVEELCANIIDFDKSLYDKLQAYRLRNTLHADSNLYKIPIDFQDLHKGLEYIKSQATHQVKDFVFPEYPKEPYLHLAQLADDVIGKKTYPIGNGDFQKPSQKRNSYPPMRKICIYDMLSGTTEHNSDGTPARMEMGIRLASHFKKEGYGKDFTTAIMHTWNQKNQPPLKDIEIENLVRTAYRSPYDYGCNDPVHKYYCDINCYLFHGS